MKLLNKKRGKYNDGDGKEDDESKENIVTRLVKC